VPWPKETNLVRGLNVIRLVRGDPRLKEIALTFDDGPHPPFTARLLDLLRQLNVRATFFLVGKKVVKDPDDVARMVREGHDVANHTYDHINLSRVPADLVQTEIRLDNDAIRRACGIQPVLFRPPGGHHEPSVLTAVEHTKMTIVLWTDDPADYAKPGADVIEARLLKHVHNGAIILLHDGVQQTADILPDFVARMRREGYRFVTVSEMAQHLEAATVVHR
jgi:peptidoglycan/xylan/chitin deacetylase (PgdA/CDA1 family)